MVSTFFGINIGYKGLSAHQVALDVTGHNIANASTEGYSRQRAELETSLPYAEPGFPHLPTPGQLGSGVEVAAIKRLRDTFVDLQIRRESETLGNWSSLQDALSQIEGVFAEPSENSLNDLMGQFWDAWQEVSKSPESLAVRANLKESGQTLSSFISRIYSELEILRTGINDEVRAAVGDINNLATQIRDLNIQVVKIEAVNDNANDLRDKRDLLVDKLANLVNITVIERENGAYVINIKEKALVENDYLNPLLLDSNADNDYLDDVRWTDDNKPVNVLSGELAGLLEARDDILPSFMSKMDDLAIGLIEKINELHQMGFGLNGSTGINFFEEFSQKSSEVFKAVSLDISSATESVNDPSLPLNGLLTNQQVDNFEADSITPAIGSFIINRTSFSYDATYDSMNDIISRINDADVGVIARLDAHNRLVLESTPEGRFNREYTIFNIEDESGVLMQRLGFIDDATPPNIIAIDLRPPEKGAAKRMAVSAEILADLNKIAADGGYLLDSNENGIPDSPPVWIKSGPGDGAQAVKIAQLANDMTMLRENATFDDYYKSMIAELGVKSQEAQRMVENQELLKEQLINRRESVSGVSLDEEMTNMIRFQHGYQASARVIQTMDRMLETIIALVR